jgi:hypothetical protein
LSFGSLGIPGISAAFVAAGSSMLTVNFVDDTHMLVTFGTRDLVPRIPSDPVDDDDRMVAAELIELPSGKVLAKTRWHLHDHARYLWSLGQGRFLLREAGSLGVFAPLANLSLKDPFLRVALPHRGGLLDAIILSPDARLLTVESHRPAPKPKLTGIDINLLDHNGAAMPQRQDLHLDFYRISGAGSEASPFNAVLAGSARAAEAVRLPVDGDGYLVANGGKRGHWLVDFEGFGGKPVPVGAVDSGCPPGLELVSPTQWVAFACRGATPDSMTIAAYDFAKHEIWEEPMGTMAAAPVFALAPAASRFAISRRLDDVVSSSNLPGTVPDQPAGPIQEVRVYGTQTGDLLLTLRCVPAFRNGENFDLSPDGMHLAIARNGAVEIFRLPELTKVDREDLVELRKLQPPESNAPVDLRRLATSEKRNASLNAAESAEEEPAASPPTPVAAPNGVSPVAANATAVGVTPPGTGVMPAAKEVSRPALASASPSDAAPRSPTDAASTASGDPIQDPAVHRKPPTLLNPGEKAEATTKPAKGSKPPPPPPE